MRLGALLVLIGLILVVIDFAIGHLNNGAVRSGLLHAGVILIGIGVLVGHTMVNTND